MLLKKLYKNHIKIYTICKCNVHTKASNSSTTLEEENTDKTNSLEQKSTVPETFAFLDLPQNAIAKDLSTAKEVHKPKFTEMSSGEQELYIMKLNSRIDDIIKKKDEKVARMEEIEQEKKQDDNPITENIKKLQEELNNPSNKNTIKSDNASDDNANETSFNKDYDSEKALPETLVENKVQSQTKVIPQVIEEQVQTEGVAHTFNAAQYNHNAEKIRITCALVTENTKETIKKAGIIVTESEKGTKRAEAIINRVTELMNLFPGRRTIAYLSLGIAVSYTIYNILRYQEIPLSGLFKNSSTKDVVSTVVNAAPVNINVSIPAPPIPSIPTSLGATETMQQISPTFYFVVGIVFSILLKFRK